MDYFRIYDQLIDRARQRTFVICGERHHVVPRCLGGGNESSNLVQLTHEEHYVAHQLLVKMHPHNHKLIFAAHAMLMDGSTKGRSRNKQFAWLRKKNSEAISARRSCVPHTPEACAKMSATRTGRKHSPEHAAAISAGLKGVPKSAEHNAKVSEALKGKRARLGQTNSPEHRAKQSAAIHAYHARRRAALAEASKEQ